MGKMKMMTVINQFYVQKFLLKMKSLKEGDDTLIDNSLALKGITVPLLKSSNSFFYEILLDASQFRVFLIVEVSVVCEL